MMVTFLLVPVANSLQHRSPTQMLPTYESNPKRALVFFPTRWEIAHMSHFRRVLISTNQISLKFLNLFNRNRGKKRKITGKKRKSMLTSIYRSSLRQVLLRSMTSSDRPTIVSSRFHDQLGFPGLLGDKIDHAAYLLLHVI